MIKPSMEIKFFEINEKSARLAKGSYSFKGYIEGSESESYRSEVEEVYRLGKAAIEKGADFEKVQYICDRFSERFANWINRMFQIRLMCPSVMIVGAGNFPTKKKGKQNEALRKHYELHDRIMYTKVKLRNMSVAGPQETVAVENIESERELFKVIENYTLDRLQLVFNRKPDEKARFVLKKNGYKWSQLNKVWQRQLTDNARKSVLKLENDLMIDGVAE
jgi:hypothetical protein